MLAEQRDEATSSALASAAIRKSSAIDEYASSASRIDLSVASLQQARRETESFSRERERERERERKSRRREDRETRRKD